MRFILGFLVGVSMISAPQQPPPVAVPIQAGETAIFTGVLVPVPIYLEMAQADLDLPIEQEKVAALERGHALAITAMENALEQLQKCQPRKSTADRIFDGALRLVPLALAFQCMQD